ncbi:MAG: response regulator [Nitrospirota bacterium]
MKNILVLDDNDDILEALSANLCMYLKNCNIMTASNGKKGSDVLDSTAVDLILTDLDMPVEDGFQFIERTRKSYPGIPVCVMTGDCAPQVKERLRALGVKRHIQKPFHFEAIANAIREELKLDAGNA